jgi:hypothetical protein
MKISLKHLTAALLCICAAALTVSCVPEEENKWEGTKLVVKDWPEGVSRVSLNNGKWTLNLYEAKETMAYEYFTGNTVITIYYDRLSDSEYDKYFGYGIRTDSENPFKVFINGEEAENEAPLAEATLYDEKRELNVSKDYFRTSFDVTGIKTVELTFENAPEKIKNKDIRLYDDNQWAYIDINELFENFKSVNLSRKKSGNNWMDLQKLAHNGLYLFDAYWQEFYVDYTVKDNYYSSLEDARFTVSGVENAELTVTETLSGTLYRGNVHVGNRVPNGTVIKLSGGTITAYDVSAFAGKSLVFSENITNVKDLVTSAALTLTDNSSISAVSDPIVNLAGGRTFFLTIGETSWSGTWVATGFDIENRPVIKLYATAVGDDGQYFEAELVYYNGQLNDTPGPCWTFYAKTNEFTYWFIFKLA